MPDFIFATSNKDKIREFRHFEKNAAVDNLSLQELDSLATDIQQKYQPVENGATFLENAFIKARDLQKLVKAAIISEDSGLQVSYLNNEPGIHSARLAATSAERNQIILNRLAGIPYEKRDACFFACICFLDIDGNATFFNGKVAGKIAEHPLGENGFGFDPIFYYPAWQKTFGQVSVTEKQTLSHRGLALKRLFNYLGKFY